MDESAIASVADALLAEDVPTAQHSAVHLQILAVIENLLEVGGKPVPFHSHRHSHARISLGYSSHFQCLRFKHSRFNVHPLSSNLKIRVHTKTKTDEM